MTNGRLALQPGTPMDYLSMRVCMIQTDEGKLIPLDNYAKIQTYLDKKGMEQCNPRDAPITEDLIKAMHTNKGKLLIGLFGRHAVDRIR